MRFVVAELRETRRQIVRANRRLALSQLEGVVAARDEKKWLVRLDLGPDPASGETILSPWLRPHANSSGAYKASPALPAIGDRMRMMSPSGIVGAASYALPAAFDDGLARPDGQKAGEAVAQLGKTRISQTDESIVHATEKTSIHQSKDAVIVAADEPRVKGKVTRLEADSIDKLKLILGGQAFHIRPEALIPTSA